MSYPIYNPPATSGNYVTLSQMQQYVGYTVNQAVSGYLPTTGGTIQPASDGNAFKVINSANTQTLLDVNTSTNETTLSGTEVINNNGSGDQVVQEYSNTSGSLQRNYITQGPSLWQQTLSALGDFINNFQNSFPFAKCIGQSKCKPKHKFLKKTKTKNNYHGMPAFLCFSKTI